MSDLEGSTEFNLFVGRSTSILIILSLLEQDHEHSAYSLIKKIKKLSHGKLSFRAGTIYPQFEKLTRDGLIVRHIRDIPSRTAGIVRQKSVYTLTLEGQVALRKIREDWEGFNLLINQIIDSEGNKFEARWKEEL